MADAEATVYRLATGDTSNGGNGDQFFVELKSYSMLREKHDQKAETVKSLSQTVNELKESEQKVLKSMAERVKSLEESNQTLEKAENDLKTQIEAKQEELNKALNQTKLALEAGEEDRNKAHNLQAKTVELEKYIENLLELNTSIKHANAELTSNDNLSKSLSDKIKLLEESNQKLEQSNNDLIIASTEKQEELKRNLQEIVNEANSRIQGLQSNLEEQQQYTQQLLDLNTAVKQANAEITNESKEKLEIALEEVKKANAAEKLLRVQSANLIAEMENQRSVITTINKELTDLRNINAANEEKMAKMKEQILNDSRGSEETKLLRDKHQELYQAYQSRLAEISQLKIINDRINRENKKWENEIKKVQSSSERNGIQQDSINGYFVKIREAFLSTNSIDDEGSKKALPDEDISELIINLLKVHKGMKHHYELELKKSIERARELTRQANEQEAIAATYETSSGQKEKGIDALNKQLIISAQQIQSYREEVDDLKKKMVEKDVGSEKAKNEYHTQIVQETQKAIQHAQKENENLMGKYIASQKENAQLNKDLVTAVEKIKLLKGIK